MVGWTSEEIASKCSGLRSKARTHGVSYLTRSEATSPTPVFPHGLDHGVLRPQDLSMRLCQGLCPG
eukprot:9305794-Heterocapsa_arctica.AAC.1